MSYSFGKKSKANLKGIQPKFAELLEDSIKDSPIDFSINEGVRSLKTQQSYYAQGRTKKGPIITKRDGVKLVSEHQVKKDGYGYAVDIYPFINGELKYDGEKELKIIATHIKNKAKEKGIKISWGGDWKGNFIDKPHFEYKGLI